MKREQKYWCQFYAPGSFVANEWTVDLPGETRPESIVWPDSAYAFKLWRREDIIDGKECFQGKPEQVGPMYYHPDSMIESMEEVQRNPKASTILVQNMKANQWSHVVWSRWGTWPQPWEPNRMRVIGK